MRVVLPIFALSLIAIHGDIDDEPPPAPPVPQPSQPFTVEELADFEAALECCLFASCAERHARLRRAGGAPPPVGEAADDDGGPRAVLPALLSEETAQKYAALAVRMRARPCKAHAHALDEQFVPTACTSLIVGTLNRTIEEEAAANASAGRARAKYAGEVADDKLHGVGSLRWRDGRRYVGGFVDGRFGGVGVLTLPDEGTYAGGFVNGAFEGRRSEWRLPPPNDGASYRGAVVEGKAHGWGVVTATDGVAWEGDFEAGAPRHGYEVGLGVTMRGTLKRPGRADALVGASAEAKAEYEAHIDEWQNVRRARNSCAILCTKPAQFSDGGSDLTGAGRDGLRRRLADRVARGLAARDGLVAGLGAADHRARAGQRGAAAGAERGGRGDLG